MNATKEERAYVESMLADAQGALDDMPTEAIVARASLKAHVAHLLEQLAEMPVLGKTAKADVFFGGAPVYGSQGIDAIYAGRFIEAFGKAVKWQANRHGRRKPEFCVTAPVYGSFGFTFEELGQYELPFDESPASHALEDVIALMEAAADDREEFAKRLSEMAPYAIAAVRDLIKALNESSAELKIASPSHLAEFDRRRVERAYATSCAVTTSTRKLTVVGMFVGLLPHSREFEIEAMRAATKKVYKGDVSLELDVDDLQRNWVGKSCTATIKAVTHAPQGRRGRTQYTLLGVQPPRAPGE